MNNKIYAGFIFSLSIILSAAFFIFEDFFKESRTLGFLGIFLINLISGMSFFVSGPAFLTVISGGSIYQPILVALTASIGVTLGDMISYLLGFSGRHLINHHLSKKNWFIYLEKHFERRGVWLLFLLALIPNPIFDAIGLIAGVFRYSPYKFFLIVVLGRFIRFWLLAKFGSALG
ncbi:VTT domain-containing protein [Candidatus Roizmanbacteria bacterium]|nr:VTT domain-containing protein [Candidatus Roizmanbacteria bacterium]